MKPITIALLSLATLTFTGCGTQVAYDDPGAVEPLITGFELQDLNIIADKMVGSMLTSSQTVAITKDHAPILVVDRIENRSDEHIDTEAITDTIRTQLIRSGKFRFTDKTSRDWQREEIDYQNKGGMVASKNAIKKGRQMGADYIVVGSIVSFEQKTNKILRKSYKMTLNLINLETGLIEWADETPITKVRSKGTFGR